MSEIDINKNDCYYNIKTKKVITIDSVFQITSCGEKEICYIANKKKYIKKLSIFLNSYSKCQTTKN